MTAQERQTVHVIGAGLAGLSAAVQLAGRGSQVVVYEATGQAGGRCRSYEDSVLGCRIDNGNHLLLSGNRSALAYLGAIGARDALHEMPEAAFPFLDLETGERWTVRPNQGPAPWWVFARSRRVPRSTILGHAAALRLPFAGRDVTAADILSKDAVLARRFWEPLTVAALNAPMERASARLLWRGLRESFAKGGQFCRPMIARHGLSETFVAPALAFLAERGAIVCFSQRLRSLSIEGGKVAGLRFADGEQRLGEGDQAVLAVPPSQLPRLLPAIPVPEDRAVILNAHFLLNRPAAPPGRPAFLGLVGGTGHWVFVREDVASVTISAADQLGLADAPEDQLMPVLWQEVRRALGLAEESWRAARLIRERRSTFDQSPAGVALRPKASTGLANLVLAGDYTDTGLPATIEGAIRSGEAAARLLEQRR